MMRIRIRQHTDANRRREEVQALAERWGQPRLIEEQISVAPGLREETVHDFCSDRWGEVVMVIRRAQDGLVWVMTKESFPQGLYSLPTGGIRHGEEVSAALWRELQEETGFEVQLQRFLAVIRYVPVLASGDRVLIRPDMPDEVLDFVSYVFLLEEMHGDSPVVTGGEKIAGFRAVWPEELLDIAQQWRRLSGSSEEFHDLTAWGRFRSLAHQVVGEALGCCARAGCESSAISGEK
jgi:ADP-ribose pyrophosphatase YjhB (NUDIX family)